MPEGLKRNEETSPVIVIARNGVTRQSKTYADKTNRLLRFARNDGGVAERALKPPQPLRPCGTPPLSSGGFREASLPTF